MEHTPRKIIANTFLFSGTLIVQKVVSFLYFWFLSNQLSPGLLGTYIWALSLTGIFSIGVDLGLSPLLIREASRDANRREKLFRSVLGLKLIFMMATLALLLAVLFISKRDLITVIVVLVGCAVMIFDSFTMSFYSFLRSQQNIKFESLGMLVTQIFIFVIGAYFLAIAKSPVLAMTALALGSGFNLLYALIIVKVRFKTHVLPVFNKEVVGFLLHLAPAFAVSGIFVRVYNVADSVLLGYLAGDVAVGLYSVPAKVVTALQMLIPGAFMASIYPAMSHFYKTEKIMLERIFERSLGYLLILVMPITFGILGLIPKILKFIWPAYSDISSTFILMTLGLPFLFLTFPTGYFLNACDRERKNTKNRGVITAVNIILNLIFIPKFGVFGAGIAFLSANILLLILDLWEVRKITPIYKKWLRNVSIKSLVSSIIMTIFIFMTGDRLPLVLIILVSVIIYLVMSIILRTISKDEIDTLRSFLKKKQEPVEIL